MISGRVTASKRGPFATCGDNSCLVHGSQCRNLIACDEDDDTSDPYVRVYLNSDKRNRKKTKVVKNELNPVFDEK